MPGPQHPRQQGFTLIELIVVMAIVALLTGIAAPRYFRSLEKARENSVRSSLQVMRGAIDHFAADKGRYPATLQELVDEHYLRELPEDALTGRRDSWVIVAPPPDAETRGAVFDVRSGSAGKDAEGHLHADW
jgi:type II secretion system protein G